MTILDDKPALMIEYAKLLRRLDKLNGRVERLAKREFLPIKFPALAFDA